ncbi:hypothetical protein AX15_005231 [Amanita polypyramis BW_CC]|nr:hypothetical protein AX15_005231 [Amanita polypyramis BW_CC]
MSAFGDFMIAFGICHLLSRQRTTFIETDSKIETVMCYVIISGALTSVFALAGLIAVSVMGYNLVHIGILLVLAKLYVNSYLAMLNARMAMRERRFPISPTVHSGIRANGPQSKAETETYGKTIQSFDMDRQKPLGRVELGYNRPVEIRVDIVRDDE